MVYEVTAKGEEKDRSIEREESDGRGGEAEGGEDFIGDETIRTGYQRAAWRIAVESWIKSIGYIKCHINIKVSPNFTLFLAQE